jgi:hypothetical protein
MVYVTVPGAVRESVLELICRENLDVYRASQPRLQEDVSQESQVAHDYRGRLVFELLQNADDALAETDGTGDRVLFRLTDQELWVANTGRPFTEADVRGLCGLGASSKAQSDGPKRASIGHKGLGFKSVLEITEAPEAYSDSVCFRLGRTLAERHVTSLWAELGRGTVRGVPAMRFPAAIETPHRVWLDWQAQGFRCAFRFPFRAGFGPDQRVTLADQLLTLPTTSVLFLKHLEEITIEVDTSARHERREWQVERSRVTDVGEVRCGGITESGIFRVDLLSLADEAIDSYWVAHDANVPIGAHRDGLTGPAWDGVSFSEVSVAVRDDEVDPRIAPENRRFHVFLPTKEPSGCSVLVNAAYTTDLSRQHVEVTGSELNYNAYLTRRAARTFVDVLAPHLLSKAGPKYVLQVLDQEQEATGEAGRLLAAALTDALADTPLLSAGQLMLSLPEVVLPAPTLGAGGGTFAGLIRPGSLVDGKRFPDPEFCEGRLARVCAAYGATALDSVKTLRALARNVDPAKAGLTPEPGGRFFIDPVLDLCAVLWENAGAADRKQLQDAARGEAVFPVGEDGEGYVTRVALKEEIAFYPPRSSTTELPLRNIRFLAHSLCWGSLGHSDQRSVLGEQMKAWDALFDIKEFNFAEVMRAAVLPGLTRTGSAESELSAANQTFEALAAICRLAGKTTKPDQPLPLGRLGSDRPFFNLSRLKVPCRAPDGGEFRWVPAYRVYFGRDWVGDQSVEEIADAMSAVGHPLDIHFLAPPDAFSAYSSAMGVKPDDDPSASPAEDPDDGEVSLEDDTDEALETTVDDRWRNFLEWLGVSRGLRLVHFHDVDDVNTGWVQTRDLRLPGGWAFKGLEWDEFRSELESAAASDPRWDSTDHYLYQVHNLDLLDQIAPVGRLAGNQVAETLLAHLVRNWRVYSRHTQAQLAMVATGKAPAQRTPPPRAYPDELVTAGPDLWLFRLRQLAICPTSHGPRRSGQAWRRSEELLRRLGRRSGPDVGMFLPVLTQPERVPAAALRACLDELQVRGELTPAAFTIDDADGLCHRASELYAKGVTDQTLRAELRPLYRQMFELLAGKTDVRETPLADSPLAARTADGITFLPAREVLYASVSGSRERSGVQGKVPLFVLEAEPAAAAPLRNLFGSPFLESALTWTVHPSEAALEGDDLRKFRDGLRELVSPLLARLSADRAERSAADRRALLEFVNGIEPVTALTLDCSYDGTDLGDIPQRSYHVRRTDDGRFQGFVVWQGPAWPPVSEDAQTLAMALAETLEVNTVETFLSFINANADQRRQLLNLAGAAEWLDEIQDGSADDDDDSAHATADATRGALDQTDGESREVSTGNTNRVAASEPAKAALPVPLHRFEDLLFGGQVIRVAGITPAGAPGDGDDDGHRHGQPGGSASAPRAAAGVNLDALDRLGMLITFAFERRRHNGLRAVVLPGDENPEGAAVLIVDVSSPEMIAAATAQSAIVKSAFEDLARDGVSGLYPGFDILTIKDGDIDRMIELKSSGVDAQVQAMSWNEWKTARGKLRGKFWLYLVGNLRADLQNAAPFIRAVSDPFGTLAASEQEDTIRKRTVQLRVREFAAADQLTLQTRTSASSAPTGS